MENSAPMEGGPEACVLNREARAELVRRKQEPICGLPFCRRRRRPPVDVGVGVREPNRGFKNLVSQEESNCYMSDRAEMRLAYEAPMGFFTSMLCSQDGVDDFFGTSFESVITLM
nr:unnamed protein product [Digitaria exilis]